MKHLWKRFLSLTLAMAMVMSMVPVQVFAADDTAETEAATVVTEATDVVPETTVAPTDAVPETTAAPTDAVPETTEAPTQPDVPEGDTAVKSVQALIDALPVAVNSAEEAEALNAALAAVSDAIAELTTEQAGQLSLGNYYAATSALEQWTEESYSQEKQEYKGTYEALDGQLTNSKLKELSTVKDTEQAAYSTDGGYTYTRVSALTEGNKKTTFPDGTNLILYKATIGVDGYKYTEKVSYTIKVYHKITASVADAGEATGTGVTVANDGKVYHGQSIAITANAVEGYKAEVYDPNGNLVGTANADNNWAVTVSNVTASGAYTVKYVSNKVTEYGVTLTVEGGDKDCSALLSKNTGATNERIKLTVQAEDTDSVKYTYEVTVTGEGASYDETTGEVVVGTAAVEVTVTFVKYELTASETDADGDTIAVKFNGYADAPVDQQLEKAEKYFANVEEKLYLEQAILDALNVTLNDTKVEAKDVEIQYLPWYKGSISGNWSNGDSIALNGTPKDETLKTAYVFGTSGRNEKVVITYTMDDGTTLSVTREISLTEGRKALPTGVTTSSETVSEAAVKDAAAKAVTFVTVSAGDFTLEDKWEEKLVSGKPVGVAATATFAGNEEYVSGTISVTVNVTKVNEPAKIEFKTEGAGTGTHTIPKNCYAGTVAFTVTPTADGSYVESVEVKYGESTTNVELSYDDTVASGTFDVENDKSYTVTITYGKVTLGVNDDAEVALNLYVKNLVDYSARMDGLKGKLLTALLGEDVQEDDYEVYFYQQGLMDIKTGYVAIDSVTYKDQIKDTIKVKIVKNASADGKIPAVSVEDISVKVVESRSVASITIGTVEEITVTNSWNPVTDAVKAATTTNGGTVTAEITSGELPTPENPNGTVTVKVTVAESKDALANTDGQIVDVKVKLAQYNITWEAGDGAFEDEKKTITTTQYYDAEVAAPTQNPEKADSENGQYEYPFDKWVYLSADNTEVDLEEGYKITGNVTFYARYGQNIKSYTITWNAGEGTFGDSDKSATTTANWGTTPTAPALTINAPTNKSFEKWVVTEGNKNVKEDGTITGAVTYTAQYTDDTIYTITWDAGEGEFTNGTNMKTTQVNVSKNETIYCDEYPTRDGFVFMHWENADGLQVGAKPTKNTTFTAVWKKDVNGNQYPDENETRVVTVQIEGEGTVSFEKINEADKVVITDNNDGTYTIIYDCPENESDTDYQTKVKVVATPATGNSYTKHKLTSCTVNDADITDNTIDLQVAPIEVKAVFTKTELVLADNAKIYVNKYLTLSADKRIDGLKAKILKALLGEAAVAENYTVVVNGVLTKYDLDNLNDATKLAVSTALLGDSITVTVKDKTTGLSREATLAVADSRATLSAEVKDVTIASKTAKTEEEVKEEIRKNVTLTATDPQTGDETPVTDYTISFTPSYEWPADGETKTFTVAISVVENAELYANTLNNIKTITLTCTDTTVLYTVTYKNGYNDTPIATYTIAENEPMQTPADPTRAHYTFDGWDKEIAATVTESVTYTAKWTVNTDNNGNGTPDEEETYTVVYKDGYSEDPAFAKFENVEWGTATPKPEGNPDRGGWNFKGWEPTVAETVTAPAKGTEIVYTATWTQKIPVTFVYNDDVTKNSVVEVEKDGTLSKPEDPVREKYIFLGWYNGDTKFDFANTTITGNITLTAKWAEDFNGNGVDDATEAHYKITYVLYEGVEDVVYENVLTGLATPKPEDPTRTGYVFDGWNPEVAATVTGEVTYTAAWKRDINKNGVDDAEETITITVTKAKDTDSVTVTGAIQSDEADKWVYDSKKAAQVSVKAVPTTTYDLLTRYSDSYVSEIKLNDAAQDLTCDTNFSTTVTFDPKKDLQVEVTFKDAAFILKEERILDYYPGQDGVQNKDVYKSAVEDPAWDDDAEIKIEYLAREKGKTVEINIDNLDFGTSLDALIKNALKAVYTDGKIKVEQTETWVELNADLSGYDFKNVDSYEKLINQLLEKELSDIAEAFQKAYDSASNPFAGAIAGANAVAEKISNMIDSINSTAQYYGAHAFGYNASTSQDTSERIRISYKDAARNIRATETIITLHDYRTPTKIVGSDMTLVYRDFKDSDLLGKVTVQTVDGATVSGAAVTLAQESEGVEKSNASENTYAVTFCYAGNETYKPAEATFQVTITKAPASMDIDNVIVTFGQGYAMNHNIVPGNQYGDAKEIEDSLIKFVVGLDVANLSADKSGITGANTVVQLMLPDNLKSGLGDLTGNLFEDGVEMSLSDLVKALELINADSLEVLKQALEAISNITGDFTVRLGGKLPTNTGTYLYGAVSTSGNYETVLDVAYIIIKPDAEQVHLDWNHNDTNGIFTDALLQYVDLGASAYDDEAHKVLNTDATAKVRNLFFGVNKGEDNKPKLVLKLYGTGINPENFERDLGNGGFTQMAFIADFGNTMHYAIPIVRAFAIVPNTVNVSITDNEGTNFHRTYDGEKQELTITVNGNVPESGLEVTYVGVTTKGKTYKSAIAPTDAGAYVVTAVYQAHDENGKLIGVGLAVKDLLVLPAETETTVDDAVVTVGEKVALKDIVHVTAVGDPDKTILTAQLATDGSFSEIGMGAISGNVNVDFPQWVDEILKDKAPEVYANGVTVDQLSNILNVKIKIMLDGLDLDDQLTENLAKILDQLTESLNNLPVDANVTFNDTKETAFSQVGVYLVGAIVTDSNYLVSADYGLVVVKPNVQQVYLDWNYHDDNGIWTEELLKHVDLYASAYDDAAFQQKNDEATESITHTFLTVDSNGKVKVYHSADELSYGAYLELAYIELKVDGTMTISDLIARPIVTVPNTVKVEFVDENNTTNYDRKFSYDGNPHAMNVRVTKNGTAVNVQDGELTVTYRGVTTSGEVYNSNIAPTNAGAYTVTAVYAKYENGTLIDVGAAAGAMAIEPAKVDFSVTGGIVAWDGKGHGVTVDPDQVDYTLISATANVGGNFTEIGIEAISGNLNVDFPAWVDEILAEKYPKAYADGIEAKTLIEKLEAMNLSGTWVDTLVTLLEKVPATCNVTFRDNIQFEEPGVYVFAGFLTDFNYVPASDTALLVIQKKDSGLKFEDTTVYYNGKSQSVNVTYTEETDYVTVIVDRERNIANILFEDDLTALKNLLEEKLGYPIPESIDVTALMDTINKVINDVSAWEYLPADVKGALEQLNTLVGKLPQNGTIYIDGGWRPVDAGEYEFYGISVSPVYQTELLRATLTIKPAEITITVGDQEIFYGETEPEAKADVKVARGVVSLDVTVTRDAGTDAGEYDYHVSYEKSNNYTVVEQLGKLTIKPAEITITVGDQEIFYGETEPEAKADVKVARGVVSLDVTVTRDTGTNAGEYDYHVSYEKSNNYTVVEQLGKLTIKPAEITITVKDAEKTEGEADPENVPVITVVKPAGGKLDTNVLNIQISRVAGETVGEYDYIVTYNANNANFKVTASAGKLTIKAKDAGDDSDDQTSLYPIPFDPNDPTGTIKPGATVEIDGKSYVLDDNCTAWVENKDAKIAQTYIYNAGADAHHTYPTHMYVWYLTFVNGDDAHYDAQQIPELTDFFQYHGTSIRVNFTSNGIRFMTSVNEQDANALIGGSLIQTNVMSGYRMTQAGTLFKWFNGSALTNDGSTASSLVYGVQGESGFRVFQKANGRDWFTGMLTNLGTDKETLQKDLVSRPYAVLERNGETVTIYGGTIQRNIYYVAKQNENWQVGTVYNDYIKNIIAAVEGQ